MRAVMSRKIVFREHLQQDESRFVNVREQIHKTLKTWL
ncbi:hypothetical protein HRED_09982 [Candidatus Haloredivivus sp. G17]|nr:hypothetical protein HRED_09982 [Candidatus Haloredivivus sp. G17]